MTISNLAKFNKTVSAILDITFSKKPKQISPNLYNTHVASDAFIKKMTLEPAFSDTETDNFRPMTTEELAMVVIRKKAITLHSLGETVTGHVAPNGKCFTAGDILNAVVKHEMVARPKTNWFNGIDCHHVYFEGIDSSNGVDFHISWGS